MQNSLAKKFFAVGSAAAMVLSLAAPFVASADTVHADGTNVSDSTGTVYMIVSGQRRPYTSAGAFLTYGFNSFASVVSANSADLALPVGAFIPPQDGSIVCSDRGADKGTCYEISGGQKFGFTSAAVFTGLGFSFSNALSGDVSWMAAGANLISNTTAAHLPGTLINNGGTVQLVGANGLLGVPDLATFNSWGYSFAKVVPANASDKTLPQTGVFSARSAGMLSPSWTTGSTGNNGGTTVQSGSVSASLSSDTPAAGTLVSGSTKVGSIYPSQTGADIAHFTFNGTGTITQVVVNRIGVSADTSVNNVYLYMGNNRITDAGSFSNGMVTFSNSNGLFNVNGSTEINVRVDVAGNISGQTVGAQLSSFTVANGSPVTASISGNLFTTAAVSNLATANVTGSASNPPATGTNDVTAGITNYPVWSYNVSVGQRSVLLKYISFKQIGSIAASAIQNLHLYVDGAPVGPVSSISTVGANTNVVNFDLTGSPVTLTTGGHLIELHGDVVGGTSYTFDFSLQNSADVVLVDPNYNVNLQLTNQNAQLVQLAPGVSQISSGTVSIQQDPSFTATQYVSNSSGVTLGSWTMKAYGENVKVQNLQVTINVAGGNIANNEGFNNLAIYVNGGQVGSSQSALNTTGATTTSLGAFTFGSTNLFTIPAGTTVTVQVKGDSVYNSSTYTSSTVTLNTPARSLQGAISFALTPTNPANYVGQTLTTSANSTLGTLTKNSAYTSQTVSSNNAGVKLGSYTIQASNADGIRLNSVVTGIVYGSSTFNNNGVNNSGVSNIANALANIRVVVTYPGGVASSTPQQTALNNTFSLSNVVIPANQTATVDVYGDVSNATGTIVTSLYANGQGQSSNQTLSASGFTSGTAVTGQTLTVGNGTVSTPTLQTSSPVSSFVIGGTSNQPAATFNFVATNGTAVIQELDFNASTTIPSASGSPITSVTVGGVTAPIVGASSTVTGLNITVPTTFGGIDVPVTVSYSPVGQNGINETGTSVNTVQLVLTRVKYLAGSNTTYLPAGGAFGLTVKSNTFDLVASAPTLALVGTTNSMTLGNSLVGKITVTANAAGNIVLNNLPITASISGGTISTSNPVVVVDDTTGQSVTTTGTFATSTGGSLTLTLSSDNTIAAGTSKTYDIYIPVATITGTGANSASVALGLGTASSLTFNDVNSGATNVTGGLGSTNFIVNYPTGTVSIHN